MKHLIEHLQGNSYKSWIKYVFFPYPLQKHHLTSQGYGIYIEKVSRSYIGLTFLSNTNRFYLLGSKDEGSVMCFSRVYQICMLRSREQQLRRISLSSFTRSVSVHLPALAFYINSFFIFILDSNL